MKTYLCAAIGNKLTSRDSSLEIPLSHSQQFIGGRPGIKTKYTAHVTPEGILKSLEATLFIDCGSSQNDAILYASFCLNTLRACGQEWYAYRMYYESYGNVYHIWIILQFVIILLLGMVCEFII